MPNNKKSKSISLRLFLDGVETRIIGATVNQRPYKPDTASIRLPSHPAIEGIKEKTLVHIFYNDEIDSHKDPNRSYKLLFEGQVAGAQTRLNQSGQSKVIQAQSMAGYLTQTKVNQTFLSGAYGQNVNQMDIRQKIRGEDEINLSDKTVTGGEISSQIKQEIIDRNNLTDACHAMMRIIFEHNSFLRDVMRRMRILDRFPLIKKDSQLKIDKFLTSDNAQKLIKNSISNTKDHQSVLALINNILNIFFYRLNLNSTMLNTFNPVPKLINSPPPACNILTPDDFSNLTFSESHRAKPTRIAVMLKNLGINSAYIWPPGLAQPSGMFDRDSPEDVDNFGDLFTNEELTKGPRPKTEHPKKKVTKGKEKNEEVRSYYMNKAQFNFNVSRRNANNLNLSGRFNPEVFPGFTSFVVAPSVDVIFGELTSVTHSIDNQNNTATTSYKIGMPYKLLTNPDNLDPPETNPALTMDEDSEYPISIDKLNNIYNSVMNHNFKNNAVNTYGEQGTLTVKQGHIDKYFNGRFDKEKYKKNPVLKRAVVAMGQYLDSGSFIGAGPGDKVIKVVEENETIFDIARDTPYTPNQLLDASNINSNKDNLSEGTEINAPDSAVGGETFRRRTHPSVEMVFKHFYKSETISKGAATGGDIWDLYNIQDKEYIKSELEDKKDRLKKRVKRIEEDVGIKEDKVKGFDDSNATGGDASEATDEAKQELNSEISGLKRQKKDLLEDLKEVEKQLENLNDEDKDEDKPVLLKTEYNSDDYDLQNLLLKRQEIILTYNKKLTESDGGIVGNMDIFTDEIFEDDNDDSDNNGNNGGGSNGQ